MRLASTRRSRSTFGSEYWPAWKSQTCWPPMFRPRVYLFFARHDADFFFLEDSSSESRLETRSKEFYNCVSECVSKTHPRSESKGYLLVA